MTNLTMPTAGVRDEDYKIYHASLRHNFSRYTNKYQQAGAELGGWVVIIKLKANLSSTGTGLPTGTELCKLVP